MSGFPGLTGGGAQDHGGERRRRSSCPWRDRPRRRRAACASPGAARDTRCDSSRARDEEARLHERLMDRDESALLECLDRFGHIVYSISLSEISEPVLAETVTERVFVQLWRRPETFHPRYGPLVLQLVRATLGPSAV